jgi:crotonobetainyl-CoA:carnitine CoA-transferase CaiB-like acyl-CoA transferase
VSGPPNAGAHNREALSDWGFSSEQIDALEKADAI